MPPPTPLTPLKRVPRLNFHLLPRSVIDLTHIGVFREQLIFREQGVEQDETGRDRLEKERKLSFDRQMKFLLKAEQDEKAESPREAATPRPEHGVHLPPGWGHSAAPATDRHRRSTTPASSSADARETPRTPRERSDYARGGGCGSGCGGSGGSGSSGGGSGGGGGAWSRPPVAPLVIKDLDHPGRVVPLELADQLWQPLLVRDLDANVLVPQHGLCESGGSSSGGQAADIAGGMVSNPLNPASPAPLERCTCVLEVRTLPPPLRLSSFELHISQ